MLAKADVFVQNLKPGALAKLGFAFARACGTGLSAADLLLDFSATRRKAGRLCPAPVKAYDLLIQAESDVSSVTGGPEAPARVGVSIVDIAAGLSAYETILEALIARGRTGDGAAISISMFDAMAEWMTIPLLNEEYGNPFKRVGLAHPTIAPYGVFATRDGAEILIAIQNDREWRVLVEKVLGDASLGSDPKFATVPKRDEHRIETNAKVAADFAQHDAAELTKKLEANDIAFARLNDSALLSKHPHLRRISVEAPSGPVSMPAPTPRRAGEVRTYGPVPALGAHSDIICKEFSKE